MIDFLNIKICIIFLYLRKFTNEKKNRFYSDIKSYKNWSNNHYTRNIYFFLYCNSLYNEKSEKDANDKLMEETKSYPRFTFGKILSIHHDELFYKLVKANSETLDYSIQLLINSLLHRNFFGFFSFHQISLPIFVLFKILHTRCITFNVDSATSLLHNPQPIFFPMPTRYTFIYRLLQSKNIPRMH